MPFDPSSGRITAVLDYDFASILHLIYEFLRSFDGAGGQFRGWSGEKKDRRHGAQKCQTQQLPLPLPTSKEDGIQWDIANAWADELEKLDMKRPSTIQGI
jgi:hypothetical protein